MQNKEVITLLFTSDVHGQVMPINYGTNEEMAIGLAKYATVVKRIRKEQENLIVIDNGDLIQGSPLMTHYVKDHVEKHHPIIHIYNELGLDVAVIGNHEFNFGQKVLSKVINESNFPWLSANILNEHTKEPMYGFPYIIKELRSGIKIAIVGVTTHFIPNWEAPDHIKGLYFADAFSTLKKWVSHIHSMEKPNVLIATYHGGFERSLETGEPTELLTGENQAYQMCKQIDGIDILLTGHQHRELIGNVHHVLVVQPGSHGRLYSEITIDLEQKNDEWTITHKEAKLHDFKSIEADRSVIHYMEDLETSTQTWLDQPVGSIDGDMTIEDPHHVRMKKHPFIQFIQDVQMDASGVDISVTALLNNETTGFNRQVSMRDIVFNYMFMNTLVVLELTGQDIIDALEKSAEYFTLNDDNEIVVHPTFIYPKLRHYDYDMWEGIHYTIHVGNERGNRVKNVTYHGKPLQKEGIYKVALSNYRASGGGNYKMFTNKPIVKEIQTDTVELICNYFREHGTVKAHVIPNFSVQL